MHHEQPEVLNRRSAGILLHITSLPSCFGIGDFGPEAYKFADFLSISKQKYWQILPLNPTDISPYSAHSSMAGNVLLISPQKLADLGLLTENDLHQHVIPYTNSIDINSVMEIKKKLLKIAYTNYLAQKPDSLQNTYLDFLSNNTFWLDDYAIYTLLKTQTKLPWFEWELNFKNKDKSTLVLFHNQYKAELEEIKWLQFVFSMQWKDLKAYCNDKNIKIFGDLPMYVSYDSVDVWANKEIFCIDNDGKLEGVAGVPPDYFSEDGQLWGMPVFRWDILKSQNYEWWVQRIIKNLELYDLIRLDHFRAFAAYWQVPAHEITAVNGSWMAGPGADFFNFMYTKFGSLPFVAEDLGEIDVMVDNLRDEFNLPGMKILQFAFGSDFTISNHTPHNYTQNFIAYTGTHDNNTTIGWLNENTEDTERENIYRYSGIIPNAENVHLILSQMAYASVAHVCVLPMQDVLGLDENSRLNTPGSIINNWLWRIPEDYNNEKIVNQLATWVDLYNRV